MIDGRQIPHTKYTVLIIGDARVTGGRFGNAVQLNGQRQYIDLGSHYQKCFGNLDLCTHGLTLSFWLNPRDLRDGTTFLSTPTYKLYYKDGRLISDFRGKKRNWSTTSTRLRPDEWQRLTLSWHPKKGLSMYINDETVDTDQIGADAPQRDEPASEHVYVGRDIYDDRNTANMLADELQVWYDDLDQLRVTGQYRGKMKSHHLHKITITIHPKIG